MKKLLVAILGAALLLAGCATGGPEVVESPSAKSTPTAGAPEDAGFATDVVPDLTGLGSADAATRLADLDMNPKFIDMKTGDTLSETPATQVLQTYPAAGEKVRSGRDVSVFVASPEPAEDTTAKVASAVVRVFAEDGLPVTDPRDNTSGNCETRGCAQMITTDDITVLSFVDEVAAANYVAAWGPQDHYQYGIVVLSYAAARTPEADRQLYEAALVATLGAR
jgi:hypothetical protein